jgi:hypothetical protein
MEDKEKQNKEKPTGHVVPMTDGQLLQHEESFINSFTE